MAGQLVCDGRVLVDDLLVVPHGDVALENLGEQARRQRHLEAVGDHHRVEDRDAADHDRDVGKRPAANRGGVLEVGDLDRDVAGAEVVVRRVAVVRAEKLGLAAA